MFSKSYWFVISLFLASTVGCVGSLTDRAPAVDGGPGGGGEDAILQTPRRVAFEQNVAPLLTKPRPKGACIICHQGPEACPTGGGSCFLGEDGLDHYSALITSRAVGNDILLITGSPATSRFLQRGDHLGNAFCTGVDTPYLGCTENEAQLIADWINLEGGL